MINNTYVPISVIVPCFRCANTIHRAVQSIEQQTKKPCEVILVEDSSGDGTLEVLYEIERQYSGWIKLITLPNNFGAATARNLGWSVASQPYIAFLDSDDSWHPDKLLIQYQVMLENPDISLCGHQTIWLKAGSSTPNITQNASITKIYPYSLLYKNAFSTPSVMLKRNIPVRFQSNKRYAEDLLLWQQIAFAGLGVLRIESPLAYVYKPLYGATGLSANLWRMESAELDNLTVLYAEKSIGFTHYALATLFSIAKFIRRLVLIKLFN
ncbi:glycosyltransferase family 2 protein [Methylomonas sp. AM2-LC]|uniref:glycosyltransferase family 2 protein n=1 Tax=Methylomonas sp. AM2-LC TaxID=3153301 RepID=UPI003265D920